MLYIWQFVYELIYPLLLVSAVVAITMTMSKYKFSSLTLPLYIRLNIELGQPQATIELGFPTLTAKIFHVVSYKNQIRE